MKSRKTRRPFTSVSRETVLAIADAAEAASREEQVEGCLHEYSRDQADMASVS